MLALFEFSRLYFSTDKQDQKEADGIKKAFTDGVPNNKPVSKVRYVVTAFRPTLVRELVAKYYEPVVREQYPELMVQSSGQTTIGIYKSKINKSIPLSDAIKKGTSPEGKKRYILFFKARDRSAIDQAMSAYAADYMKKHQREHPPIEQVIDPVKEMLPGRKKERVRDKGMQR